MASKKLSRKPKPVQYRRRRESKTNYKKRLHLVLSQKPRLVVRFTNQQIIAQVISFNPVGDKVLAAVNSFSLKKLDWIYSCKNTPASYLTGLLIGKKALAAGVKEAIFDTGFKTPLQKGKSYAFLKGVLDSGLEVPHGDESIFPSEERISGEHLAEYLKSSNKPGKIPVKFAEVKRKITSAA